MVTTQDLLEKGGAWLAAARRWMQWNKINGSTVTWGSNDILESPMTVKQVEELAACVAAAVINSFREQEFASDLHELLRLQRLAVMADISAANHQTVWDNRKADEAEGTFLNFKESFFDKWTKELKE